MIFSDYDNFSDSLMTKTAKDYDTNELIESEIKFAFLNLTHTVQKKASDFCHL